MKENQPSTKSLIGLQKTLWYLLLGWFLLVTVACLTEEPTAVDLASWGIMLVLAGTVARLFVMAELLRRSALYRYWLLTFALLLVLLSTIALKYCRL